VDNAIQIVKTLGYESHSVTTWWTTHWDELTAARAATVAELGSLRPSPAMFGFRQSPQYLDPVNVILGVTYEDPPPYWSARAVSSRT
jgi:hypothetical protein